MNENDRQHRAILESLARRAMLERGLLPDFSTAVLDELGKIQARAGLDVAPGGGPSGIRDLRDLLWSSIDNDDSRDLDQLTVATALPGGSVRISVAVADVDSLVKKGTAIDEHARHNTTSVYTAAAVFPMLPEKLACGLTSLNLEEDCLAVVVDMTINADGSLPDSHISRALVRNRAKLAYNSVAEWLEGKGPIPREVAAVRGLDENLRRQDRVAQSLKAFRHRQGALTLETVESKPVFEDGRIRNLEAEGKNRAKEIIEDFMIAANGATVRYLSAKKFPLIRRVVRSPERWARIVELAGQHGFRLPADPDSRALEDFLTREKASDSLRFPDLSLTVIKLLGAGEYVAEGPGDGAPTGHFGLAVRDYTHSTAPNRRYTDLITQRLLKAAIAGGASPYGHSELDVLAAHCTEEEDAANKVERQVGKSAAALLLESRIGEQFEAIITGASAKGTWARLLTIPVEGRLLQGFAGVDVGDRVRVQLISVDVERGFIDFKRAGTT